MSTRLATPLLVALAGLLGSAGTRPRRTAARTATAVVRSRRATPSAASRPAAIMLDLLQAGLRHRAGEALAHLLPDRPGNRHEAGLQDLLPRRVQRPATRTATRRATRPSRRSAPGRSHETCYKDCEYTFCKPCYKTGYKEVCETVCKPVCETCYKECHYTVCKQVPECCEKESATPSASRCARSTATRHCHQVCKTICEQHCREVLRDRLQAGLRDLLQGRLLHRLQAGLRDLLQGRSATTCYRDVKRDLLQDV